MRIQWRTELLTATRKTLESNRTNSHLAETILDALDRAMAGRPISVGGPFATALRAQECIGWRCMLQGYWAREWQIAFRRTYPKPSDETDDDKIQRFATMDRWQARLIRVIWTGLIRLWTIRNDDRHGRGKETREQARHTVLTNELKRLYDHPHDYPPSVRHLLRPTFQEHCQDTSSQIEDWLSAYSMTFQVMHIRSDG